MHHPFLPQGSDAALNPGAAFSVPGLFAYSELVYDCIRMAEEKFGYRIPVPYIYGSPRVRWNCGRIILRDHKRTMEDYRRELELAVSNGIKPLLTFSSPTLTAQDLEDPVCRELLDNLGQTGGGVIVSSPLLAELVRKDYPQLELHASVILNCFEKERSVEYYRDLSSRFDHYVLHTDDNFEPDLLDRVPKENAEILLNERCRYQCHQRREHYLSIAEGQRTIAEGGRLVENFLDRCPFVPEGKQAHTKDRNIALTTEEMTALYRSGFKLFKLQGRLDSPYFFFFDFLRYALEPQVAFPTLYPVFTYRIADYLRRKEQAKASVSGASHAEFSRPAGH